MTTDIDTRLDEILLKDLILATDDGQPYIRYTDTAVEAIKQLMADEFEKLIGKYEKVATTKYLETNSQLFTKHFRPKCRNELRNELSQKLKEWKQ